MESCLCDLCGSLFPSKETITFLITINQDTVFYFLFLPVSAVEVVTYLFNITCKKNKKEDT